MAKAKPRPFPTKEQVAAFIRENPAPVGKREIARAFQITGANRVALKALLRELQEDGLVERGRGRRVTVPDALPEVTVVIVEGVDTDGEVIARPSRWEGDGSPPRIFMAPERRGHPALGKGDRVLARLKRQPDGGYAGSTIRKLGTATADSFVGVFRRKGDGGEVKPADKRRRDSVAIASADSAGAADGELVIVEQQPGHGRRTVVVERLGDSAHPRAISLISIHGAGLPTEFPAPARRQAEAARPMSLGKRVDLRSLPLVTIDGADARDFDDAVWAEPDSDPNNAGGWHLVVAIADVAAYVTSGSPLDREAFKRGNSCYFPNRVVPMLPEALSNGLCSLRPQEDRACLAAHLWID
ncbi:MAG: RNB domain-containing ribonuclease, partial [Inquilinus sp.]|nr:RNB domain-containing ribonuclease [Inquilinus sp.]